MFTSDFKTSELCFLIITSAVQVVNKLFGLKNNNNLLPVVVVDFARVALMFELLKYYSSQEKYRGFCGSAIN